LVELLEQKFTTYYIKDTTEITLDHIQHFNFHTKQLQQTAHFFPSKRNVRIVLTSGASCPDSIVENVMNKLLQMRYSEQELSTLLSNFA
jgi:4-hydroxy-3-methylbut-2-enyl diphosphate reductase